MKIRKKKNKMSCNYQETDVSKISRDIQECKASGQRIAALADQIKNTIILNEQNKEKYNKDIYMWNRAESQFVGNINTITDRIRKIEAERQADWGTRCGALGAYDYHCQLGNFLNKELYPQLAIHQNRYNKFLSDFPKPTYNPLPVPNFENTMVCQACVQCVNQSGNTAGGNISTSLSQVNNCTVTLEKKLEEAKKTPIIPITPVIPIQPVKPVTPVIPVIPNTQKSNTGLILLLIFIFVIFTALGLGYYFYDDLFGKSEEISEGAPSLNQ